MQNSLIVAGLILLAGCKPAGTASPTLTTAEATRVAEQAEATFTTGNLDAIMKQYADKAVMFDASHAALTTDRKVQTRWAQSFVSMRPADYRVPDRQIQLLGNDAFISSGTEIFTIQAGTARPTISGRFTDVYQRQPDGSWKIVNEHVSTIPTAALPQ